MRITGLLGDKQVLQLNVTSFQYKFFFFFSFILQLSSCCTISDVTGGNKLKQSKGDKLLQTSEDEHGTLQH